MTRMETHEIHCQGRLFPDVRAINRESLERRRTALLVQNLAHPTLMSLRDLGRTGADLAVNAMLPPILPEAYAPTFAVVPCLAQSLSEPPGRYAQAAQGATDQMAAKLRSIAPM
jgi:hypothetical protein